MEGVTGYVFRRTHHAHFHGIDQYYTPFVVAGHTHHFKNRERTDVDPENNAGVPTVPQILTNNAEDFLWAAGYLADLGYSEVNLNLGCPVGTVSAKGKGSGFLRDPEGLERFLDAIYQASLIPISLKTRIGYASPDEAARLIEIYNQYPVRTLIVHPRTREEFYGGQPHLEVMDAIAESARMPLVYNGDVCTVADAARIMARYPHLAGIMIGRGLLTDPALVRRLVGGEPVSKAELRDYHAALLAAHEALYTDYTPATKGGVTIGKSAETALINRMKELWTFLGKAYADDEHYLKQIRKAQTLVQYQAAVRMLMNNCDLADFMLQ